MLEPPKDVGKQRQIKESYAQNPLLCRLVNDVGTSLLDRDNMQY